MIQELLGGSNVGIMGGEITKLSNTSGGILDGSPSPTASSSPSPSSSSAMAAAATTSETLRCPRCDSSNTKFCYYNNYNLTQPRHFCKTCRRYWTKGGALRNVPIGGGCRKNKSTTTTTIAAAVGKSSTTGKLKTFSPDVGKSCALFSGYEHSGALPQNPIFWANSPQNSHLLSLLRANQNPNPNAPLSNPVKEEGSIFGSHLVSESSIPNNGFHARALGFDPLGPMHAPSMGLSNSFYRTNNQQPQANQAIILGEVQNNGLQELYQKLRSSTNCYSEHAPVILGNMGYPTSSSSSTILESAPVAGGELGFWNSTLSWPTDMPTTNGAYP